MLRILLLMGVLNAPANSDRLTALDFICIYGNKCKVLDSNLHGNNEFGFAEFANKREKIAEAIKRAKGMLSNEKFISKAPAAKVEAEKEKLEKYTSMAAQVAERLSQLKK